MREISQRMRRRDPEDNMTDYSRELMTRNQNFIKQREKIGGPEYEKSGKPVVLTPDF